MKREDILEKHGKILRKDVQKSLNMLGNSLFENWTFINGVSSKTLPITINKKYETSIAQDWLIYDCAENKCNKAGYVLTVQHMYHEYRHIQQYTKEWNTTVDIKSIKNVNRMTDIVRRNFIRNFYDSAYTHNYTKDPGELDAEVYGLKQAMIYFKNNPMITQKEADQILFQFMMSEDYGHKNELDQYHIKSVNDMMNAFTDLRNIVVHGVYPVTTEISPLIGESTASKIDMTEEFLTSYKYRTHREELKTCTDGRQQDKLLEQTIVMKYPDIGDFVPRLKTELNACKKQMQSRILTPKNHAVPVSKINYAVATSQLEDDFTAAVNAITENEDLKL